MSRTSFRRNECAHSVNGLWRLPRNPWCRIFPTSPLGPLSENYLGRHAKSTFSKSRIFNENVAKQKHTSEAGGKKDLRFLHNLAKSPTIWLLKPQIRAVIDPERMATLQLASFLVLALAWQTPAPSLGSEQVLTTPVVGSSLINSYRQSETEYSAGHRGVDYEVELGQGVFAPGNGQVHFVGKVVNRQLISISHEGGLLSAFEPVCSQLQLGDQVAKGDLIGEICEAEDSYQPHCEDMFCLHFSIRRNGQYLSPLWFTGELSPSRLLPWVDPDEL